LKKNKCKKKESDLGKEKKKNEKKSKSYENNTKKKKHYKLLYCVWKNSNFPISRILLIYKIILERNIITQRQKTLAVEWPSTQKQDRIPTEPYKHKGNYTRKKELPRILPRAI
jgi:hypothetical protein